jgi:hypothetical protein
VPALIDRIGDPAGARDLDRRPPPRMAGLPAPMQQQHRPAALAENVGGEAVARRAGEGFMQ